MNLKYFLFFCITFGIFSVESVHAQCNAKFKPTENITNLSCNFQNQSSGGMIWYFWDFGDGTFITDTVKQNQTHFYSQPGIYKVTLTVQDTAPIACIGSYSEYVVLVSNTTPICFAHFSFSVSNDTASFTNQSLGTYHILSWDFGDGSFGNSTGTFTHIYSKPGYYPVTLSIMDTVNHHASTETQHVYIPITTGCAAAFNIINIDSVTHTVVFNSTISGAYTDILWNFGDGAVSAQIAPVHTYNNPGVYKVSLTVYNSDDNTYGIYEERIEVNKSQLVNKSDFNHIPDLSTPGKVYFANNSINAGNVQCLWNFGDGHFSTDCNPTHVYAMPGIYNVALTIYDHDLKKRNTINKKISTAENNICNSDFTYLLPQNQPGNTVKFIENETSPINEQMWDFGDNSGIFSHAQPLHTYATAGFYPVMHKAGNNTNMHQQLNWVNVNAADSTLQVYFIYYTDSINSKAAATTGYKSAVSREVSKIHWNFGNGDTDTTTLEPVYQYPDSGTYQVCLTVWEYNKPDSVVFCRTIAVSNLNVMDKINKNYSFIVHPNPVTDKDFIVQLNENLTDVKFQLMDALGKNINMDILQLSAKQYKLVVNSLVKSGIYLLHLQHAQGTAIKKIVVQN